MTRTIIQWLELLPQPYRDQAIKNALAQREREVHDLHKLDKEETRMYNAIDHSFQWSSTPEGQDYWQRIHEYMISVDDDIHEKDDEYIKEYLKDMDFIGVTFSTSTKEMLQKLSSTSVVARHLLSVTSVTKSFADYVSTRGAMMSFLPHGREHKVNPETNKWMRDGRQEMKPAKLARKLLKQSLIDAYPITDEHFEKFGNSVRAYLGIVGDEFGEGKNIMLEVVKGEAIREAYHGKNYSHVLGDSTNLHGSCMRGNDSQKYFGIYVENEDVCSMLLAKDTEGKILGRALLWNFRDGEKGMDTIYGADVIASVLKEWAIENGYWYKSHQSCHHHIFNGFGFDEYGSEKLKAMGKYTRIVDIKNHEFEYYPFVDTLYNLNLIDGKYCLSNEYNAREKTLRNTNGYYEEYDEDDDDDYVTLESGERCHTDDAYYLDYRSHEGIMVDGYYHESEVVYCEDDTNRLRDDCTRINGNWYSLDDDEIAYVDDRSEYFMAEDTVYCEQREMTIHVDDATQVEDGWCDSDYAHECAFDGLTYHENVMIRINDAWVHEDNKESYLEQIKEKQNEQEREEVIA